MEVNDKHGELIVLGKIVIKKMSRMGLFTFLKTLVLLTR